MDQQKKIDVIKDLLGKQASKLIQHGMVVGLGSGSTSACFIRHLIERVKKEKLSIETVASSEHSLELAKTGGLKVLDLDQVKRVDITIDGADEIDLDKQMIKGGGGAHLREKIVARESLELVILVDETKLSDRLGKQKLPVEILSFGAKKTEIQLQHLGYKTEWRRNKEGALYITDNGNYLLDIHLTKPLDEPEADDRKIRSIPGVIETGLFLDRAPKVFIGRFDGSVEIW